MGGENGATMMLYEGGHSGWTTGVTTHLYNKLNSRDYSLPEPEYVAMGSEDRYYVLFADGKSEWVGPNSMHKALEGDWPVKSVAFGQTWESYFIVYEDGGYIYCDVPEELVEIIESRQRKTDLVSVSLGPEGEYYLKVRNGRAWWGGMASSALADIDHVKDLVTFLQFGDNESYLCRYE